jgi:hypothetical protein
MALVRKLSIPTEQPPLFVCVNAKFADRGCHEVIEADPVRPYSEISRPGPLLFLQVAPQLYSRG